MLSTTSGMPCRVARPSPAPRCRRYCRPDCRCFRRTPPRVFSSISLSIASACVALGKADRDALARQDVREQRVRGAVELRHRDDVAAHVGEVERWRNCSAAWPVPTRERVDAAFELGDAPFQHGGGRIADAAVAIAFDLEIEQSGAVIGAVELVGHGLVDRNRNGACRRLGLVAAVNRDRVAFHFSRHAIVSLTQNASALWWSMIFSENRRPLFRIMLFGGA